ncbi:MAG: hypothetical protein ACYDCQ_03155 [Dehalococcoidia bacterium]
MTSAAYTFREERLAADCRFLRRTIESGRLDGPLVTLCTHPIRDGFDCVGPFIEDMPTACGLWEQGRVRQIHAGQT